MSIINQHLIDPEICIRCDTCESICPIKAITHNDDNYVVNVDICNGCMDCISPCPTGAIDNWRKVSRSATYSIEEQFIWEALPGEQKMDKNIDEEAVEETIKRPKVSIPTKDKTNFVPTSTMQFNASLPPWSAAHAYTNLYGPSAEKQTISATVMGNIRVTKIGQGYDTHHIVLDFGAMPFPVLEGQSIGIIPPGENKSGKAHHARQYSVSSPRNGERPEYNNISLTIKRVLEDREGNSIKGVASNFMCDSKPGDKIDVTGPFGASFLMPNHPQSNIVMICTGTGSAPMRAMTEWRRRLRIKGKFESGKLMLFFGARTQEELPYFGPLQNLPEDFIDTNFAFSRTPDQPKCYVQDLMHERAKDMAELLKNPETYVYVCGLKSMEEGVLLALSNIAEQAGLSWQEMGSKMKQEGRLHLETY